MKTIKLISSATAVMFLTAVAQPIAFASMIDNSQKTAESAQTAKNAEYEQMKQQQEQQNKTVQQQQAQFNNTANPQNTEVRQTIYDASSGQMVTIVKSGYSISAYNSAGQQIPVQAEWVTQINAGSATSNMSGSTAQQLASVASVIKTDGNLNTIGKLVKALLALEAIKANNQLARQQYAKQIAQQRAQQAQSQPTAKTTIQQKDSSAKGKGEIEYASVLRDGNNQTGGTMGEVNIANPGMEKQSSETPLQIDLIGKIVGKDANILTIEDATGRKINVKVDDPENYNEGDNLNATGRILSGSDANLYVMQDEESGMGVQVSKISDETYNYKAEQQQAAAEQFAAEYPQAAGLAGTGAAGQYQAPVPAPEEDTTITEISGTGEALVPPITNEGYSESSDDSDDGPGLLSQAGDWIMSHKMQIAGAASIVAGGAMVLGSGALTLASGATLSPLSALGAKVGYTMISGGIGAFALGTFNNYAEEEVERRHPDAGRTSDIRQKGAELEQEVQYNMTEANQN